MFQPNALLNLALNGTKYSQFSIELRTFPKKLGFSKLKTTLRREFWNILRGETLVVHATAFLSNDRFLLEPSTRAIGQKAFLFNSDVILRKTLQ